MDWDVRNKPVATTAAPRSNGFSKMSSPGFNDVMIVGYL